MKTGRNDPCIWYGQARSRVACQLRFGQLALGVQHPPYPLGEKIVQVLFNHRTFNNPQRPAERLERAQSILVGMRANAIFRRHAGWQMHAPRAQQLRFAHHRAARLMPTAIRDQHGKRRSQCCYKQRRQFLRVPPGEQSQPAGRIGAEQSANRHVFEPANVDRTVRQAQGNQSPAVGHLGRVGIVNDHLDARAQVEFWRQMAYAQGEMQSAGVAARLLFLVSRHISQLPPFYTIDQENSSVQ